MRSCLLWWPCVNKRAAENSLLRALTCLFWFNENSYLELSFKIFSNSLSRVNVCRKGKQSFGLVVSEWPALRLGWWWLHFLVWQHLHHVFVCWQKYIWGCIRLYTFSALQLSGYFPENARTGMCHAHGVLVWSEICTREVHWRSSCMALTFILTQRSRYQRCCTGSFLSDPFSVALWQEWDPTHSKPPCNAGGAWIHVKHEQVVEAKLDKN